MGCESSNEKRYLRNNPQQKVQLTLSEKAILDCKSCRDKIKKYIKNLEQKEEKSKLKVKELLQKKQRSRAKSYLKQCKLFSEQIKVADGQLVMINEQITSIESTANMNECAAVLNQGNVVLKKLQKEVNIEHWDNIRDDLDELKERDREVTEFFKEKGVDEEELEEECEEEINKMIMELQGGYDLPNVPQDSIEPEDSVKITGNIKSKTKNKKNKIVT